MRYAVQMTTAALKSQQIIVSRIPPEGIDLPLRLEEGWVAGVLKNLFPNVAIGNMTGGLHVMNHEGNVAVDGKLTFVRGTVCARCGTDFLKKEEIPIHALLAPCKSEGPGAVADAADPNATHEDLEFAFYKNDSFFVDEIVNDAVALALPYNDYCRPDCQGLCPACAHNLNDGPCKCVNPMSS